MEEIKLAGFLVSAGSSYAAFLYKLGQFRRGHHDVAYRALMVTLGFQCLTFTMGVVALTFPEFLGVRNLAILAVHLSAVGLCISARIVLLLWAGPLSEVRTRIRYWLLTGAGLGAALVALFFAGGAPGLPSAALNTGSSNLIILTYLLLFIVSQAIPCVVIYRQCLPYARVTPNLWLRRALRLLAISAVVLLLYCVARTFNILSPLLGIDIGSWQLAATILSATGIVILSLSLTMPSWGAHLSICTGGCRITAPTARSTHCGILCTNLLRALRLSRRPPRSPICTTVCTAASSRSGMPGVHCGRTWAGRKRAGTLGRMVRRPTNPSRRPTRR